MPRLAGVDEFWWGQLTARRDRELDSENDNGPVDGRFNANGRRRWWSAPNRTLEEVLDHIHAGNQKVVEQLSLDTLQPLDDDTATEWSLRDTTEAELELQRRLLAEAEQRKAAREREAAANAARLRVPPPPPQKENEYIILDPDSDDEGVIQQALEASRWDCGGGDEGQGTSKRPGDGPGDDDDDGGDYSQAIAASLGLK